MYKHMLFALSAALAACAVPVPASESSTSISAVQQAEGLPSEMPVAEEGSFILREEYGTYELVELKNESDTPVSVTVFGTAVFDGVQEKTFHTVEAIPGGGEGLATLYYPRTSDSPVFSHRLSVKAAVFPTSGVRLSAEVEPALDGAVLRVENIGEEAAKYVTAYVLYLDRRGDAVGLSSCCPCGPDGRFVPGGVCERRIPYPMDCDTAKVFLTFIMAGGEESGAEPAPSEQPVMKQRFQAPQRSAPKVPGGSLSIHPAGGPRHLARSTPRTCSAP